MEKNHNPLIFMVRPRGFEPLTYGFVGRQCMASIHIKGLVLIVLVTHNSGEYLKDFSIPRPLVYAIWP